MFFPPDTGAPERFLAVVRLDHPWPMLGAGAAALLLGLGALRQQTPDGSVRLALAVLSTNAALRCAVAGFDRFVAHRVVARAGALTEFLTADQLSGGALVLASVGLVIGFVLAARRARLTSAAARQRLAPVLTLTAAIALLCSFDAARLTGVCIVAQRLRLEAALAEPGTPQPPVRTGLGGVVPERVVLLSATGATHLVDAAGMRDLRPNEALPADGRGSMLLADAKLSVADLLRVVGRVPADEPLRLGSLNRIDAGRLSTLAGVPVCRTTITSVPIVTIATGAETTPILGTLDLRQLPPTTRVSELTPNSWLLAPRAPARDEPPPPWADPDAPPVPLSWRALASFYVLGW